LPKQDPANPAGRRHHGRIDRNLVVQAVNHEFEEFCQAAAADVLKAGLPAEVRQRHALA